MASKHLQGIPLATGYAKGTAWVMLPLLGDSIPHYSIPKSHVGAEIHRLGEALLRSKEELEELGRKLSRQLSGAEVGIVDAHVSMLQDPVFLDHVRRRVKGDLVNVDFAVAKEIQTMAEALGSLENDYLRERATDLEDVGRRLLRNLSLVPSEEDAVPQSIPQGAVLVARELLPSQTMALDRSRISGIVTELGGPSSHAAILARSLGIPFVAGIPHAIAEVPHNSTVLINGSSGEVLIDPGTAAFEAFAAAKRRFDDFLKTMLAEESEPCVTPDGRMIRLWANIGSVNEAKDIEAHQLTGIGLFRSEFLFMNTPDPPSVELHASAYRELRERLNGRSVTIRTMDLGGDKVPAFVTSHTQLRGLRFSLAHPHLLEAQIRGILRASRSCEIQIMFPMVIDAYDLEQGIELVRRAAEKENRTSLPRIGAMIETPSAVFDIENILGVADFISVGTNDLTQYTLASDRGETDEEGFYSVLYPGVLKALQIIAEKGNEYGHSVCVCGEVAGDPTLACLLVGLGFDDLSMSPIRATAVRHAVRGIPYRDMCDIAGEALACRNFHETRKMLRDRLSSVIEPRSDAPSAAST